MHRLITIPFSHYNEKARWALDRYRVPYREERYMPVFHFAPMLLVSARYGFGRADNASTPLSTPTLIREDGVCLHDSCDIVRWASDRYGSGELFRDPEVGELERHFGDELGPHTRRFAYYHAFGDPSLLPRIADHNVDPTQARWFKRCYPIVRAVITRKLRIDRQAAERSLVRVRAVFDDVGARIRERRYLVGDRFSAADLAFACMAAPVLMPSREEGYGGWLPPPAELGSDLRALIDEMRGSTAGAFALRMFASERRPRD